jgi:hypothetical protein
VGVGQLVGERVEPVLAPRHENEVVAAGGQLVRDRAADTGGRAGDERG